MPACGLQHRYDVYVQFMQMSPFPPCGRVSMRCLLFLWYQAATQHISLSVVSVLIEVHHCRAASERLRLNIFSLPFLISECVLICLCIVSLCYCTSSQLLQEQDTNYQKHGSETTRWFSVWTAGMGFLCANRAAFFPLKK